MLYSQVNGGEWELYPQVTALCVGNAKYFGGGMKITPNAVPGNGNLEVQTIRFLNFKSYFVNMIAFDLHTLLCRLWFFKTLSGTISY